MSEFEKVQRDQYQLKRNKCIFVQKILLILLSVAFLLCMIGYIKYDRNTYVYYTEDGNAIYKAYLSENDFYDEEYLNGSHAYVSSLVEKMTADFSYNLSIKTNKVEFKYNYHIDAQLEILDINTKAPIYNPTYEILPLVTDSSVGNHLSINKHVEIDFQKYDGIAKSYLSEYKLQDTSSTLIVRMYVNVVGESETFANDRSGEYVTELRIPLVKTIFKPEVSSTIPAGEQKILAINKNIRVVYGRISFILGFFVLISATILTFYVISTRNKHIDYRRRVDRIHRNYRSYIQQITNKFDMEGYQILYVKTIDELLDIHDTLQKPIMSYENEEKTNNQFFIVADFKIIYLYELYADFNHNLESNIIRRIIIKRVKNQD